MLLFYCFNVFLKTCLFYLNNKLRNLFVDIICMNAVTEYKLLCDLLYVAAV